MKEYTSIDLKETRKSTRIIAIILGLILIAISIVRLTWYGGILGAIIIAAMIMDKKTVVCEEGIVVRYDVIVYQYKEVWPWEDIQEIHKELAPDGKRLALHFMKEIMSKRLVFSIPAAQEVMEFAKAMNPKIHIGEVNK